MPPPPRQRLRFDGVDFQTHPDGGCSVSVAVEWNEEVHEATAEGIGPSPDTELRLTAHAVLEAAEAAVGGRVHLSLIGVKTVRAFDSHVVIVATRVRSRDREYSLLGTKAYAEAEHETETTARAILDSLNRVLELYVDEAG